jgi:uncharacterized repeat protein (TIGR03803 family)
MRSKRFGHGMMWVALLFGITLVAPQAWAATKYKILHTFIDHKDGGLPGFNLVLDHDGNLYGVTYRGGTGTTCSGGCGTVFELTLKANGTWSEEVLHNFASFSEGDGPNSGVVLDGYGNLYGVALASGTSAVFEMIPRRHGWHYGLIYNQGSQAGLTMDSARNIYGYIGPGKYGDGEISELVRGSDDWNLELLYSFCNPQSCADGDGPVAPLSWDSAGNLYGTMLYGGNGPPKCPGLLGCGVAFEMTPNSDGTWKYNVPHRFAAFADDGQYPDGGLVVDASGSAYGVTAYGGVHGSGRVFKLTPASDGQWKQTVLYDFSNCANGCFPGTTLVFDKAGNLYGVGSGGLGDCQGYACGLVFKLTRQSGGKWKYCVVHKFTGTDGGFPNGVIIDGKGNLYGTTQAFGADGYGVAFEITP